MRFKITSILFLVLFTVDAEAQLIDSLRAKVRSTYFTLKYNNGAVLSTNDFVNGINNNSQSIDSYQSLSVGYGKQTRGRRDWEHIHNFPEFGIAFYTAKFQKGSEIGYPNALYGFYRAPFHRWQRSALMFNLGFGLTYNWRPYHADDNPFNVAIGSHRTVYVGVGLGYNYSLSPHWVLATGLEATHFSNGAMRKPNKGINLVAPYVSVNYLLSGNSVFNRKMNIPHQSSTELYFSLGAGRKRGEFDTIKYAGLLNPYQDVMYRINSLSTALMRQYSHKSKAGLGIDIIYDEWLGSSITVNDRGEADKVLSKRSADRYAMGMFVAHEFCISRLSVVTQVGTYLWRSDVENKKYAVYQRAGLKYHFSNDMFIGINIFAHKLSKADFIEWNAGYRFRWFQKKVS